MMFRPEYTSPASPNIIRLTLQRVASKKDAVRISKLNFPSKKSGFGVTEGKFATLECKHLLAFHGAATTSSINNIEKYVDSQIPKSKNTLVLRIVDNGEGFRVYSKGHEPLDSHISYKLEDFPCVYDILHAKTCVVHNDSRFNMNKLVQWRALFGYVPDLVCGIPVMDSSGKIPGIVAVSMKGSKMPRAFFEKQQPIIRETLSILGPYALMIQRMLDCDEIISRFSKVMNSVDRVAKIMAKNPETAPTQVGLELSHLIKCQNLTIFRVIEGDAILKKIHTSIGTSGKAGCPNKQLHSMIEIPFVKEGVEGLVWAAQNKKGMMINHYSEYAEYKISPKTNHAIGSCSVKGLMIIPIVDYSGEFPLVIELCEPRKTFSSNDYILALTFSQHIACVHTCTKLLDSRDRNFRRRNIINEMLSGITFVKPTTVEQFITHHRKTSSVFRGNFDEFSLCIRCFSGQDIAGIALELFYQLGIVKDFKIRRSILIRFIVSVQQGYGNLPYHNWYHAVSVAHYAYILIRKLQLIKLGHITKLEGFALVVSALTHDIDHRGTNNQFQSYTNSDIYKLYNCEDSVMERHHLAIALAILHREDCNILESFSDADYKHFVQNLTSNIIATDISKHMKVRDKLFREANFGNPNQKKLAKLSLFMTAADLCDGCKKWDDNLPTVKGILQEFFNQGDMERKLGFQPIPMMDRYAAYIPSIEYKFTRFIVLPVYKFLSTLYIELQPCVDNILKCEELWTRATFVFDKHLDHIPISEQLQILDLPDMKENNLMSLTFRTTLDQIRQEKFSAPPAPTSTAGAINSASNKLVRPISSTNITRGSTSEDEILPEVNTGEYSSKKCCCCWC